MGLDGEAERGVGALCLCLWKGGRSLYITVTCTLWFAHQASKLVCAVVLHHRVMSCDAAVSQGLIAWIHLSNPPGVLKTLALLCPLCAPGGGIIHVILYQKVLAPLLVVLHRHMYGSTH